MRWDWNASHRLNCFARGHSCCCGEEQGKILFSYFQLSADLVRDSFWAARCPHLSQGVRSLVSGVLSLFFLIFPALNKVPGIWSLLKKYLFDNLRLTVKCYLPQAQTVKCLSTMWETLVRSLGWEVPWRRKWQPTPVLLFRKSHGQ